MRSAFTPFLLAAAIAYVGHPLARAVEARQVRRTVAIVITYTVFICIGLIVAYALLPSVLAELDQIASVLPAKGQQFEDTWRKWQRTVGRTRFGSDTLERVSVLLTERLGTWSAAIVGKLAELIVIVFGSLFNLALALFLSFFVLRDREMLARGFLHWFPPTWQKDIKQLAGRVDEAVGGYVRSQLIVAALIGASVTVGLMLLDVKYAFFLGFLTAVADFIPYFGPIVSAVPAIGLALLESPAKAVWVAVLLFVVQQLEGGIIAPKIVGDQVGLHPLTVIFSLLAGGELGGIIGLLVAVPVTAALKVVATFAFEKMLDRHTEE